MECGVSAAGARAPFHAHAHAALSPTERSPAKSGLHVNFSDKGEVRLVDERAATFRPAGPLTRCCAELQVKERREKFLTAKYGSHQMALIRKRLAVEMWLYDELQKLYDPVATVRVLTTFYKQTNINICDNICRLSHFAGRSSKFDIPIHVISADS